MVGNVLGIGLGDLAVSAAFVTMLPGIVGLMYRPLVLATFDPWSGSGAQATWAVA
ncbi:MAG TPA: hypothetical protein VFA49_13895 [Chloroflexota bacterium]|nr:hypothetical protein [Chloroflexota bacterium]